MLLESCDKKNICVLNIWLKKGKVHSAGGNETKTKFALVGKDHRKYLKDAKVFPLELQHGLIMAAVVRKHNSHVMRNKVL